MKPYKRVVQYYETDKMGIVHHSNYIRWMEEARGAFLEEYHMPYQAIEEKGILIPVLSVSCRYHTPARFGDKVKVEGKLTSFNGVKFSVSYRIKREGDGELLAEGESDHALLSSEMKPIRLKKEYPEVYQCFLSMLEEG